MCSQVTADLSNARTYIQTDDGNDLFSAAYNARSAVHNAPNFYDSSLPGSPQDNDLSALMGDANSMQTGNASNTAQQDLNNVMHDCGH